MAILFCRFCRGFDNTGATLCPKCGYRLQEYHRPENDEAYRKMLPDTFTIGFRQKVLFWRKLVVKNVTFEGYDLHSFWNQLHNAHKHNRLMYRISPESLTLYTKLSGTADIFSFETVSEQIPGTIVFSQELWYDSVDPATGYNVYQWREMKRGSLLVNELPQEQRLPFLKWLLSTPPHASENGSLYFEI